MTGNFSFNPVMEELPTILDLRLHYAGLRSSEMQLLRFGLIWMLVLRDHN